MTYGALRKLVAITSAAGLLAVPIPAWAQQPHQHGVSGLLAALDGEVLTLELSAPGKDIAGFEHAPNSKEQRQHYNQVMAVLTSAHSMFHLSEGASCKNREVHVLQELIKEDTHDKDHAKPHDDDHREDDKSKNSHRHDEDEHKDEEHGEFRLRYEYDCTNPGDLKRLELLAFERFANMRTVNFQFVGPMGQTSRKLTAKQPATDL